MYPFKHYRSELKREFPACFLSSPLGYQQAKVGFMCCMFVDIKKGQSQAVLHVEILNLSGLQVPVCREKL